MKIAILVWEGRIPPLFDVAKQLLVVDVEDGKEVSRWEIPLEEGWPPSRISQLAGLAVEIFICGGISRSQADSLHSAGITVISQITGKSEEVLTAFLKGDFLFPRCTMPGATEISLSQVR